jgi:hypothetical protein
MDEHNILIFMQGIPMWNLYENASIVLELCDDRATQ